MSYNLWFICSFLIPSYMTYQYFTRPPTIQHDPDKIKALLAPPNKQIPQLLLARALPNARLVRAFHLNNTFVNASPEVHEDFVRHAKHLMKVATPHRDWVPFRNAVIQVVQQYSPRESQPITTSFPAFVQSVTLAVVLTTIFGVELANLDIATVSEVTEAINTLWCLSKTSTPAPPHTIAQLEQVIQRWMPNYEGNALDFIIPIYENMWRLVATAIARILGFDRYISLFTTYLKEPTSAQFQKPVCDGLSVKDFMNEVLRCHPPTKRIGRVATYIPLPIASLAAAFEPAQYITKKYAAAFTQNADIEALHLAAVWGEGGATDPQLFDPKRFSAQHGAAPKDVFMPFGHGPLKCVAEKWAPNAAALVAAGIIHQTDHDEFEDGIIITKGPKIGGREGWEGWTVASTSRAE